MVQILERPKSLSDRFAEAFARSGQSISPSIDAYKTAQSKKLEPRKKLAARAFKDIPAYAKTHLNKVLRPEELSGIEDIYSNLLMEHPDMPEQEVRKAAFDMYESKSRQQGSQPKSDIVSRLMGQQGMRASPEEPEEEKIFRQRHGRYTPEERAELKNPWGVASAIKQNPKQALAEAVASGIISPIEMFGNILKPKNKFATPAADWLRRKAGIEELDPETQAELGIAGTAASFLPIGRLASMVSKGFGALKGASKLPSVPKLLGSQIAPAEAAAAEFSPLNQAAKESSLAGRVTKPPRTATELRVARAEPAQKLSPVKEIVRQRQEQLKNYPKYSEEIVKDSADREIRRAEKIPKTPVGEAGLKQRIAIAQQKMPAIEGAYTRALSRVRSLENALSKTVGEAKNQYSELYKIAKEELKEAQIDLQTGMSNIRSGSAKASVEDSIAAARKKIDSITDAIDEGKEVTLKGYDYSPRLIAEAKALSKKKTLQHMKGDDFYNKIHDRYLKPYQDRLAQVKADIKSGPITFNHEAYGKLKQEKEILEKMIQSVESEKIIHNHKLALREINETKKARDRFTQLKKVEAKPKVSNVAQEKMWKNQMKEARTSQERAKVIDEGIKETAAKHPEQAEQIHKEGEKLKEATEDILGKAHGPSVKPKDAFAYAKDLAEKLAKFRSDYPRLAKYGQEILVGVLAALYDDIKKEYDLAVTSGAIISASLGRPGKAWVRVISNQITRKILKEWHISKAKDQYLSNDNEERAKFMKQSPSIRKKAIDELRAS